MKVKTPKYIFSEIENNAEGYRLIQETKKYLNKKRYKIRVRGQYLAEGEDWRKYTHGQPINKSTHLRVYIEEMSC